ncbi:CHASE domain-containing protein [Erythrobacter sp. GH1-10]|uniref:CHASE domain-containing protein n=1 Tax=Erythrobacter sp. GH1-10 TaxID=3349334 RepID=UPI00387813AF
MPGYGSGGGVGDQAKGLQQGAERPVSAGTRARRWLIDYPRAIPLGIFAAIAAITVLSVYSIESNVRAREDAQMREYAQSIASALEQRGNSFSSYLRAGAALFSSVDEVSPGLFRQFVSELRLDVEYRGAEGIGWVSVISQEEEAEFLARARRNQPDFPAVRPVPESSAERLAPVTYFSPDTARNRRALGFNMHSDPVRAAAMAEAKRTVRPTASGRIVLAQEGSGNAPGFVIFMPVYSGDPATRDYENSLAGFVYSPFNAGRFLDSAIALAAPADLGVRLYDGSLDTEHVLANRPLGGKVRHHVEEEVTIANRQLLLVVESDNSQVLASLSMVTLLFGLAVASLLMLLARLLTQQAQEDRARLAFYEEQHSIRNSLSRELNHRVKNTLANVLSILSLTRRRTTDLDEFADSLEGRIRSLSATHDLLTGTDWGTTPIRSVIEAELQHFRAGSDNSIAIEGPPVELAPNDALSFGLAIHELATNAAKFGALSVPDGSVSIKWQLIDEQLAEVEWREAGGPPVAQSRHRGFGTELIEKIVAHELRNPVQLEFPDDGVRCVMRVPVRQRSEFQIRERAD